jgi:thiol:disulfide interchange protein
MAVLHVNKSDELKKHMAEGGAVVVDYSAEWCGKFFIINSIRSFIV